jgi:hypothetical protein
MGAWVSCGTPSYWFSRRRPCQCTVVSRSVSLMTVTTRSVPCRTSRVGPGTEPLYPSMRTAVPRSCLTTGPSRRSNDSPEMSSISGGRPASGRPAVAVGKGSMAPPVGGAAGGEAAHSSRAQPAAPMAAATAAGSTGPVTRTDLAARSTSRVCTPGTSLTRALTVRTQCRQSMVGTWTTITASPSEVGRCRPWRGLLSDRCPTADRTSTARPAPAGGRCPAVPSRSRIGAPGGPPGRWRG